MSCTSNFENTAGQTDKERAALHEELMRLSGKEYWGYWFVKRVFDIVFSLVALLLLSPVFLVLCILIFLDDPHGSPIYVQTRIGRRGKPFRFYKFRSMVVNADEMRDALENQNERDGPAFKMKDDPRITKMGRILRKYSLDELPQFLNVLKGDMSIVGPRPPLPDEVAKYAPEHMDRLLITPGLTCFWQTTDNRHEVSFEDWMAMDIRYIKERNLLLDMKLIFKTIRIMLTGQGD